MIPRIKTSQDWNVFISQLIATGGSGTDLQAMRAACYNDIETLRGRPLLVYATRFLDNIPNLQSTIDLSDIEGFTSLIQAIPDKIKSVDVLIHSPGGQPDATERIVYILRNRFQEVHFLIPHSAYSAATMLALSGNSIILHPSATLGPIDPQLGGTPARSIKRGFEKVRDIIAKEGPEVLPAYIPLIEQYSIHLLEQCEDSETLSKLLVSEWILKYMLLGKESFKDQVKNAVVYFSDYDTQLLHSRPLVVSKLHDFKLPIAQSDAKLSELLWESFIYINGFFASSTFYKLYENNYGVSWGRQIVPQNTNPTPPTA